MHKNVEKMLKKPRLNCGLANETNHVRALSCRKRDRRHPTSARRDALGLNAFFSFASRTRSGRHGA